ncbi:hypothetical protein MLD38_020995 [Melastoma candidum]|uniref:Uncharacterized protein n=1 Tax=Melastoma candidum TaxID=119954 RepID=A0ACB9QE61_9MYRT|nr:hypothetical protein MLD38_020995 [Melastoma candidum]
MMPSCQIILVFLVSIFSVELVRVGGYTCNEARCHPGGPAIRFPFYLKTQNSRCGYPGYQPICDHLNQTIIRLPHLGDLVVDYINYDTQLLLVRDPEGCLPRKLLSLSLDGSPFTALYNINFTILRCPQEVAASLLDVSIIWCLSDDLTVVATATTDPFVGPYMSIEVCSVWTANVPVVSPQSISVSQSIWLKWDMEYCRSCQSKGGRCRRKDYSATELECYGIKRGISRASKCVILAGVVVPWFLFLLGVAFYMTSKVQRRITTLAVPPNTPTPPADVANVEEQVGRATTHGAPRTRLAIIRGIDSPTLESYPKTRLDGLVPRLDHDVCAICLSEYQSQEMIRSIPVCGHYFHDCCIDPWLKRNGACPVCRAHK